FYAAPLAVSFDESRYLRHLLPGDSLTIMDLVTELAQGPEIAVRQAVVAFEHQDIYPGPLAQLLPTASIEFERDRVFEFGIVCEFVPHADGKAHVITPVWSVAREL